MTAGWWLAADLNNIGQAGAITLHCVCGDTHTIKTVGIQNPAIPSLVTSIVQSVDEWQGQRKWCRTHRPHGGITQRKDSPCLTRPFDSTRSTPAERIPASARSAASRSVEAGPSLRLSRRSTATRTAQSAPG